MSLYCSFNLAVIVMEKQIGRTAKSFQFITFRTSWSFEAGDEAMDLCGRLILTANE